MMFLISKTLLLVLLIGFKCTSGCQTCTCKKGSDPNFESAYGSGPYWKKLQCCKPAQNVNNHINYQIENNMINEPYGLHITQNALAQEGRSFCIVGEHIKKTFLSQSPALKDWEELLDPNLDIGSHIHPDNSENMNTLTRLTRENKDEPMALCAEKDKSYANRPAFYDQQPDANCRNPYKIEVTEIHAHKTRLHNYLHIKVFAEPLGQPSNAKNCPTGKMKFLMLEVRDQFGFPVGHFTDEIPCDNEPKPKIRPGPNGVHGRRILGTKNNHMPCMYSPKRAVSHPGIFLGIPVSAKLKDPNANDTDEYFTEAHATWRFAQHTSDFKTELHFAALAVENTTQIRYFTSRRQRWRGPYWCRSFPYECCSPPFSSCTCWTESWHENYNDGSVSAPPLGFIHMCFISNVTNVRPYGYTAKYNMLQPTKESLGGWDIYRKDHVTPQYVSCHEPISTFHYHTDKKKFSTLPIWMDIRHSKTNDMEFYKPLIKPPMTFISLEPTADRNPGINPRNVLISMSEYFEADESRLYTKFSDIVNISQPATTYFGTKYTKDTYTSVSYQMPKDIQAWMDGLHFRSILEIAKEDRCPCPKVPTTLPPEIQTKEPVELDGRRLHALQMFISWVILIPLAMFVARYYKETYSQVYFMREFWWYALHVLLLFNALLFMIGGIYVIRLNRLADVPWSSEHYLHTIFGYGVMVVYCIHLAAGFFRMHNVYYRILQIMLHWMFGMLEYLFATTTIMVAAVIPQGFVSCDTFYIYVAFLVVQVLFHVGMDIHLRIVDRKLKLRPPRSYLPPPVMRIFHANAPYAKFRMFMLLLYVLTCFSFYGAIHITVNLAEDDIGRSCYEPILEPPNDDDV